VLIPDGPDAGLVWYASSPLSEQRRMSGGAGVLRLANREVLEFDEPRWELDNIPGLRLSTDGRWAHADPGWGAALLPRLRATLGLGVWLRHDLTGVWRGARVPEPADAVAYNPSPVPDGVEWIVLRGNCPQSSQTADSAAETITSVDNLSMPVGMWAYEALRIAAGVPRVDADTGLSSATLTRLLLDTDDEALPPVGTPITCGGRIVGRLGSSAQHYVWGPIALGLLSDAELPGDAPLRVGDASAQIWA
jgi:hypothetical protein